MERKVIKMGDSSLVISLPKQWTNKAKVARGSTIEIEELSSGDLIVKPKTTETKKKPVEISSSKKYLEHNLIDHYINGADTITIASRTSIDPELTNMIYNVIHELPGLEITEASSKRIVIEYFGSPVPVKRLLTRFSLIVNNFLNALAISFKENEGTEVEAIKRMRETKKIYHIMLRSLIAASTNVKIATDMELKTRDPIYHICIVKNLEEMLIQLEGANFYETNYNKRVSGIFEDILRCHKRAMKAWNAKDRKLAQETVDEVMKVKVDIGALEKEIRRARLDRGAGSAEKDISQARVAKLKEAFVTQEQEYIENTIEIARIVLRRVLGNLDVAALNSIEQQ